MIYNIPENLWARIHDSTSDIVYCGYFDNVVEKELKHLKVGFFKLNCIGTFRIRLHTSLNFSRIFAQSALVNMSDVTEPIFNGNIRFDFSNTVLITNTRFYVTIEAVTYTRTGNTNFIGWLHDFPYPTNISTGNWQNDFPIKMELFVK